jgi:hypothetical protein
MKPTKDYCTCDPIKPNFCPKCYQRIAPAPGKKNLTWEDLERTGLLDLKALQDFGSVDHLIGRSGLSPMTRREAGETKPNMPKPVPVSTPAAQGNPDFGPGTQLAELVAPAHLPESCCDSLVMMMNRLRVDGCKAAFKDLKKVLTQFSTPAWLPKVKEAVATKGFLISPDEPIDSLLREAIRREDERGKRPLEERAKDHVTPSLMDRLKDFGKALVEHAEEGLRKSSPAEVERRLMICKGCPFFDAVNVYCNECGCWLNIKTSWAEKHCPIDKW